MKTGMICAFLLLVFSGASVWSQPPAGEAPDRPPIGAPDRPPMGAPERPNAAQTDWSFADKPFQPPADLPDRPPMDGAPGERPRMQQPPAGGRDLPQRRPGEGPQGDGMMENFFPPELVMQNQKAIDLTEEQRDALKGEMRKTMERFTDLQWQQQAETETMKSLTKQERPDEKQIMAQLEKLMTVENEIKRGHMALLVKVRNILTPEQQAKLREIKKQNAPRAMQGQVIRPQGQAPQQEQLRRPGGQMQPQEQLRRPQGQAPMQGQPGGQPGGPRPNEGPQTPKSRMR